MPNKYKTFTELMLKKTHFSLTEVMRLMDLHKSTMDMVEKVLACNKSNVFVMQKSLSYRNKMDRLKFRDFLHTNLGMTDDIMLDRIFKHFNKIAADDIDVEEWILGFNIFLKGKKLLFLLKGSLQNPNPVKVGRLYQLAWVPPL